MKKFFMLSLSVLVATASFATFNTSAKGNDHGSYIFVVMEDDDDDDDQQTLTSIFSTFMNAERVAKQLDAQFLMEEGPVNTDVFVFGLKAKSIEELEMEMFDEEGIAVADNMLKVIEGTNYRALDVSSIPDGTYTFKLKNAEGAELTQSVIIERGKITNQD